ncbi:hypothetical protein CHUAL_005800 [Chamberlinius hualienensis]
MNGLFDLIENAEFAFNLEDPQNFIKFHQRSKMSLGERTPLIGAAEMESVDVRDEIVSPNGASAKRRRKIAAAAILITLTLERLAFYSLVSNLYLFINGNPLDWMSYNAMAATYLFTGVAFFCALPGGWLADSFIGKFNAIIIGLVIFAFGYSALTFIASSGQTISPLCTLWPNEVPNENYSHQSNLPKIRGLGILDFFNKKNAHSSEDSSEEDEFVPYSAAFITAMPTLSPAEGPHQEICVWTMYFLLVVMAFAIGMIRANISPFGADQFKHVGAESLRRFFNWYYWCVNIGGFVAIVGITYIQQTFSNGFFIGYLIPTAALGLAFVIFIIGRPWYNVSKPVGSVISNIFKVILEAWRSKKRHRIRVNQLRSLHIDMPSPSDNNLTVPSWMDLAKVRYGGSFHETAVEDVKTLGKIIIVFIALIPYWLVYFQMQSTFVAQGLTMKLNPFAPHISNKSDIPSVENTFTIPVAWLSILDIVFLLIFIPLMDKVVYPFFDRKRIHLGPMFKISVGMTFALAAVLLAGGLEYYRLNLIQNDNSSIIVQVVGNTTYVAADLLIFWQAPQYALIGISEVFASVASLEFAYSHAPKSMQGIIMGIHSLCTGIGSFLGSGLLESVRSFLLTKQDYGSLNESHLDYYFFLLGGIQFVGILVFLAIAKRYNIANGDYSSLLLEGSITTRGTGEDILTSSRRRIIAT